MIARPYLLAIGGAALFAIALPLLALRSGPEAQSRVAPPALKPLAAPARPPLAEAYRRPLFAATALAASEAPPPADAPQLVGIVGRLNQDAVALVRIADGSTRTLSVGESVDGWQLGALAIDAAFFVRGSERVRVPLPTGEE